jgi:hypothetical protein
VAASAGLATGNTTFWITVDGPRDIILGPGESYRAEERSALVVSGLRPSVLAVAQPPAGPPARRAGAEWVLARLLRWRAEPLAARPAVWFR